MEIRSTKFEIRLKINLQGTALAKFKDAKTARRLV